MSIPSETDDPILIIRECTTAAEEYMFDRFMDIIKKVYQYEIFKPMLDLVATKAKEGSLVFKLTPQRIFELDEGNCKTIERGAFDKFFNTFKKKRHYTITIKKLSSDVVIHEIGHMMEKESEVVLEKKFEEAILADLKVAKSRNVSFNSAVNNVMVEEVKGYHHEQRNSELFTRYFQLLAMAKEVAGHAAEYGYSLNEVYKGFPKTEEWVWDNLYKGMIPKIDLSIANFSKQYIKAIEDIKHSWAGEKVKSFHKGKPGKKKWGKTIKSIKDY